MVQHFHFRFSDCTHCWIFSLTNSAVRKPWPTGQIWLAGWPAVSQYVRTSGRLAGCLCDRSTCCLVMTGPLPVYEECDGGMIHRCIDMSRYFSRDTYRNIFFFFHYFFCLICVLVQWFAFRQKRYIIISTCDFCKVIPQIRNYFVKIFGEILIRRNYLKGIILLYMKWFFLFNWLVVFIMNDIVLKHNSWSESGLLSLGFFEFSLIIYWSEHQRSIAIRIVSWLEYRGTRRIVMSGIVPPLVV